MKPNARTHDVTSTLVGERIRGTIDADAIQHIMGVLTDLYEDPELAIIREYSTNALDANIEAGNPAPIEVTTPSALSPFFRVKDHGVGMNADTIRDVYSKYGTSTKRESNDVVGMLGLGCKSALTYTDQFSVASTLNEVQTLTSVSRDADGGVSFTIVSTTPTSEPNGTEVIIPARRDNDMAEKARLFFRFWKPGTVLVDGKQPDPIEGMWVTDEILVTNEVAGPTIVMGNVPYPAPGMELRERLGWHSHVVAYVDIGAVSFTPSREGLQDTDQVRKQVAAVKASVEAKMDTSFKRQIEEADSPQDMIQRFLDARNYGYAKGRSIAPHDWPAWTDSTGLKHRVPDSFFPAPPGHVDRTKALAVPFTKVHRRRDGEWLPQLSLTMVPDVMVFTGFDAVAFSPTKREKLEAWKAERKWDDWQPVRFIFTDKLPNGERLWFRPEQIQKWEDVEAIKIVRTKDGAAKPRGSYQGRQPGGNWYGDFQADTIDTTKPIYWAHGNVYTVRGHNAVRLGAVNEDGGTFVALPLNRIEKFKRDFPMAKHLDDVWAAHLKNVWKPFHKDDFLALSIDTWDKRLLAKLPETRIDDPEVVRWIRLANRKVAPKLTATYSDMSRYTTPPRQDEANPLDKYPLLDRDYRGSTTQIEHSIIYINAAYAAEKESQS